MKCTILERDENIFVTSYSNSHDSGLLANFLTDSYDDEFTRKWLHEDRWIEFETNISVLTKHEGLILFKYLYDDDNDPYIFSVTHEQFIKILNQWMAAVKAQQKYIVIDVHEKNEVSIYPTTDQDLINRLKNVGNQ